MAPVTRLLGGEKYMKKTTKRRFGALVVGLSLVAAACGGSSDSDSTATAGG